MQTYQHKAKTNSGIITLKRRRKKPGSEKREDMKGREKARGEGMVQELPHRGTVVGEAELRHQNLP